LSGDEETLIQKTETWYHLLTAMLLFRQPTASKEDVKYLAQSAIENYPQLTILDSILFSILQRNAVQCIQLCIQFFENWWLVAHLSHLLHRAGKLDAYQLKIGMTLVEYSLLEYCTSLFYDKSLWQIACQYLEGCHTQGHYYIQTVIERQSVNTEKKVLKLLKIAEKHNISQMPRSICKTFAIRKLKEQSYCSCIYWLSHAKDKQLISLVVDKILSTPNNEIIIRQIADLLDTLGEEFSTWKKLDFVQEYCKLQQLYQVGDYRSYSKVTTQIIIT